MATPTKQQLTPPDGVKKACAVGIRLFEDGLGGDGLESATVREARSIVRGKAITIAKAKKMVRWWGRNARFLTFDKDSPAWVAAQLWGGRAGLSWSRKLRRTFEAEDKSISSANEKKVSEKVRTALKTKAEEHNEKVKNAKTKRTNVRTLSAVFERGVGAYNTNPGSVRPSVSSADQWAYARVNSFLFCLRNGKFRSGKHDTDLLPKGHPQSSKKSANGEEPQHFNIQSMSAYDLDSAIEVEDADKFSDLPGSEQAIEIHYRITTPFQMEKGYGDMEDDDVKIRGPVYVGNQDVLDRHGELVEPDAILNAWEGYEKNPVILYNHSKNYGVIGKMAEVEMGTWEGVGDVVLGTAIIDGGEKDIVRKIRKGMLKAFSIGFIAKAAVKECKDEEECYIRFTEIDWIETSVVDIPASPNALFNVEKSISLVGDCGEKKDSPCGCGCSGEKKEVQTKAIDLNRASEEVAAKCIDQGDVELTGSWNAPSAEAENAYLEANGWQKYGMWFLGRRADADPETKEHYAYPWSSNFKDCSRPGLNAIRSRAGQVGDEGVFNAAGRLRELMDDREEGIFIYRSGEKAEVGTDIYTSMEEAEARAEELGCEGSHSMEGPDGETLYMPCKTHDEYESTLDNPDLPMKNIATDSKSNLTASVMNPLESVVGSMSDESIVEEVEEEVPVEIKEAVPPVAEAVVENAVEVTDEVVTEEAEATEEESVAVVEAKSADDVLLQVVSVLKSVEERMTAIEAVLDTTKSLGEEVESLKSAIADTEVAKAEAEAEAAIEAEVAKRVAELIGSESKSTTSARKTLTTVPVDSTRKNTLDPNPHVSEGMNGLAKWLENQINNR